MLHILCVRFITFIKMYRITGPCVHVGELRVRERHVLHFQALAKCDMTYVQTADTHPGKRHALAML